MSTENEDQLKENVDPAETVSERNEVDWLKEEIRKFAGLVNNSSVRLHVQAYTQLVKVINHVEAVPEPFIKGIVKLAVNAAVLRYRHQASFKAVENLLNVLAKHDPGVTGRSLAQSVLALFPLTPNISESIAGTGIPPLKWILQRFPQVAEAVVPELVSALGTLAFYCCASGKASGIFEKKLRLLISNGEQARRLKEGITEVCKDASSAKKMVCLMAFLLKVQADVDHTLYLDVFSKAILFPKSKPEGFVIDFCGARLSSISASEFRDQLLPNIKKSLLRSPEVALFGVVKAIQSSEHPLDEFVNDLLKGLTSSVTSTSDELRNTAIAGVAALAIKAEAATVEKIVNYLFEQLTVAKSSEQRVSILEGIANCADAKNASSSALEKVANSVVVKTTTPDKEAHENVVAAQWNTAFSWARRLRNDSTSLISAFKSAPLILSAVRHIGYRTLAKIFTRCGMKALPAESEKQLWQECEAVLKEPLQFLSLYLLLMESSNAGTANHTKLWEKISVYDGMLKDRALSAMSTDDAFAWIDLTEKMILERPISNATGSYPPMCLKSLTILLFWPHWQVRKRSSLALERILTVEESHFAEALADTIFTETVNGFVDQTLRKVMHSNQDPSSFTVPGEWYVQVLRLLLTPKGPELDKLAIHTLLLASLQRLVEVDGSVWLRWMHGQTSTSQLKTSTVFKETAINLVLHCPERSVRDNALITLVALNHPSLRDGLWSYIEKSIAEIDVGEYVRIPERHVLIYQCSEGHLYNTEVLEFDEGEITYNMRRENKAYSFRDQVAEMQLRRELAEKKRKEGKLTAAQKQVMEKELAKEKEIRDEMRHKYVIAEAKLDEARAMVAADHVGAMARTSLLFDYCIPLTKSYLVTKNAAELFFAYRDAAFPHTEDYLDELLGSTILRVIGAHYHVPNWQDEPLNAALQRCLQLLNERAFVVETGDEDDTFIFEDVVGATQLTVLYPMIRELLSSSSQFGDDIRESTLTLLQNAIHRRFLKDNSVLQLPMNEYATLLLSEYARSLSSHSRQALVQLVSLANETEDTGPRVVSLARSALNYLDNDSCDLRENVIKVLSAPQLLTRLVLSSNDNQFALECLVRLFVARFDAVEPVAEQASQLWYASVFHLRPEMAEPLIEKCVSKVAFVRQSAAGATASFVQEFPEKMPMLLAKLDEVYTDLARIRPPVFDEVGRMVSDSVDEWARRSGVGQVLGRLADHVEAKDAMQFIKLVVPQGLADRHADCRNGMRDAAVEVIRKHGRAIMNDLLPFLEHLSDTTPSGGEHDNLRQGLVVLLGTLAQYLDPSSDKVRDIVARLMEALSTPSQQVQESVSRCLSPLVPAIRDSVKTLIQKLQWLLFEAESYGERRGAAYGIAGIVKGMGVSSLKELDLLPAVQKALLEKKNAKHREGGLLALEILCSTVGKLFEPYMIQALPSLLLCFGDSDESVRRAAEDTAVAMMSSMSPHGTKLVLPSLLTALDDESWRTKCAATELLGSMAFCAPRQLSACLPNIVPKLIEVLADSSSKVQRSGEKALRQIASVIRNPEILGVSNQLISGLLDPANKTNYALQAVLNTKFIHYIDAPSLALIMPVVRRAFEDRNSETRKVAAQIIANIYTLTEHKDMEPYMCDLVPGLQKSLLDPVPEIRTVAARALGAIVAKSTGATSEKLRGSIVPWLKEKLISPHSTVDRSGAAQGLCEVLAGIGSEQLEFVMPEIIAATESTEVTAETRDGYILMYIYLPMVFGENFLPYLPQIVPPILKALADENEYVRASALKAGQRLIAQYCSHARRLLLPQLQNALHDENWRIRHASVQLIGDFLFTISGVSGKSTSSTANEDDTMGMEHAGKSIVRALGQQCRDSVLAGLYLARSDVALIVRQAASHVWKIVVANTPRTLKEIMKVLFEMVVDSLASTCEERQQMGARCLGELVRKMGEKIINEILPILEQNQKSDDLEKRVGVAIALHEIMDNITKDVLSHYLENLVNPVRNGICDPSPVVRSAAADTFSVLYQMVGHEALDEIITPLLEKLTPEKEDVLAGLCEIMKQNSRQMLPYLLPRLTRPPINVHALCSLASVAGSSLSRQLPRVLDALLSACQTNDQYDPMIDSCEKVVIAVTDDEGIPVLVDYLLKQANKGNVPAIVLLHTYVAKSGVSLNYLTGDLLPGLLHLYMSPNAQIVDHAVNAAIGVAQALDQKEMQEAIPVVKKALNFIVAQSKGKPIPGFAHPKALQPLLPMLREAILQGGVELKALAGEALGQMVSVSDVSALKAHVVNITGPLVRVLGDRYPANVKLAVLETLSKLLDKVDTLLRPFLPQLQSTFLKALQDPTSRPVRLVAGGALARLLRIHLKPEPLVTEILKMLAHSQDQALLETTFVAARALVGKIANPLSEATIQEGYRVCELQYTVPLDTPTELDTSLTVCSGALYGELAIRTKEFCSKNIFRDVENCSKPRVRQAMAIALQQMCQTDSTTVWTEAENACRSALMAALSAETPVACAALRAAAHILISQTPGVDRDLLAAVGRSLSHQSVEVRRVAAAVLGHVLHSSPEQLDSELLKLIVPHLANGAKESNSAVRSASELALVYAFHFAEGQEGFNKYLQSVEGAAKMVLNELQPALRRVVKNADMALEPINTILSVN
uniref:TOG domain-containing protein n=2 Tax=Trichostrongylidae TaxID=6315 RepID=A0A7I4Y876_HAECO